MRAPRPVVRRAENGLWAFERVLQRSGFPHVAGTDEAGRGACAGPLVVAAVVLPTGRRGEVPGLADAIRRAGEAQVPTAVLSRGVAGVSGRTLIVNLPGSRGGVADGEEGGEAEQADDDGGDGSSDHLHAY